MSGKSAPGPEMTSDPVLQGLRASRCKQGFGQDDRRFAHAHSTKSQVSCGDIQRQLKKGNELA